MLEDTVIETIAKAEVNIRELKSNLIDGETMHEVIKVIPLDNYRLLVEFDNGEKKTKDVADLLDKPAFKPLKDISLFKSVKIVDGAITWVTHEGDEIDLCPDKTYESSY